MIREISTQFLAKLVHIDKIEIYKYNCNNLLRTKC